MPSKPASSNKKPPKTGPRGKGPDSSSASAVSQPPPAAGDASLTLEEQQQLLNLFADAFSEVLSADRFSVLLQEIKQALFHRDFEAAFGREDYLEAYAARWSPPRALCYTNVFMGIQEHLASVYSSTGYGQGVERLGAEEGVKETKHDDGSEATSTAAEQDIEQSRDETSTSLEKEQESSAVSKSSPEGSANTLTMISIGGCAAEHIAFASYLEKTCSKGSITLLDSGPWQHITHILSSKTTSPPAISKYASAAARAANKPLLGSDQLACTVSQQDVLTLDASAWQELLRGRTTPVVVTLMFTLNELYTSSGIGKTTKMLKTLGQVLPGGSLVLVVDSPGSYSEAAVGKESQKKKYPMQWLLDHTLLNTETAGYSWDRLESHDSNWFRLPKELVYPMALENMRYQMHLYRLDKS